jgi:hypothetical protein
VGSISGTIFVSVFTLMVIKVDLMRGLTSAGAGEEEASAIAAEVVGAPSSVDQLNVYSSYSASYPVEAMHQESLIAGFRANTAVGLLGTLAAALIIWHLMRRQATSKDPSLTDAEGVSAEPTT